MSRGGSGGRVEAVLRDFWTGRGSRPVHAALTVLTSPLEVVFATGVRLRNLAWDRGMFTADAPPIPTVSVGNLTVGGTGKTPVTRWLVELLLSAGERPAVVSRGFGEDELLLHRRWHPGVPVLKAPRRIEGVRAAAETGCTVAVVDDGFQHRAMHRAMDLVLLSPSDPVPARLLPRGPYREPLRSVRRAHAVLVTTRTRREREGAGELLEEVRRVPGAPPVHTLAFAPGPWRRLDGSPASPPPDGPLLAVSSIARPRAFLELVGERMPGAASDTELMAFPDHHPYTGEDLERIRRRAGSRPILTTEKDAVKLLPLVEASRPEGNPMRVLPLQVAASPALESMVREALRERLGLGTATGTDGVGPNRSTTPDRESP